MASVIATGVLCVLSPPTSRGDAAGVAIPSTAVCLRSTRHADYVVVQMSVGVPAVQYDLLLRFEAKEATSSDATLRLFSQDAVESQTVSCAATGACSDVVLLYDGERSASSKQYAAFAYMSSAVEAASYSTASQISGIDGEFFLRRGVAYWLTATHLCYSSDASTPYSSTSGGRLPLVVSETGALKTTRDLAGFNTTLASAPALSSTYASCAPVNVTLFPVEAGVEALFLSVADTSIYNDASVLEQRRTVAEIGTDCAATVASLERQLTLYQLDCAPYARCRTSPNVPLRRVAQQSLFFDLRVSGSEWMWATPVVTLNGLPGLADEVTEFLANMGKLVLVMLCALVVFVRSRRATASSSFLFLNCVSTAKGNSLVVDEAKSSATSDASIGIMAIVARLAVVVVRQSTFSQDGQLRVVVTEACGVAVSFVHLFLRYAVLVGDNEEPPVCKLGGSSAVIDSTAAILLAFSDSPTMTASVDTFDPTARLLTSLLASIVALGRCAWSAACCGVLASEFYSNEGRRDYFLVLAYASLAWCAQAAILVVAMCDLFVAPASYMMTRSFHGDGATVRLSILMSLVVASMPRLTQTARRVAGGKHHAD